MIPDELKQCDHPNCSVLHSSLCGELPDRLTLGYEDVFYPLRHHQSLRLDVKRGGTFASLKWGAGDYIYPAGVDREVPGNAIEPFSLFDALQDGSASIVDVRAAQDGEGDV